MKADRIREEYRYEIVTCQFLHDFQRTRDVEFHLLATPNGHLRLWRCSGCGIVMRFEGNFA